MKKQPWVISKDRLFGLFEGVVAIDLTLLVLELKPPKLDFAGGQDELFKHLFELGPATLAWFISFMLIARIWHEQHIIWSFAKHCDHLSIIFTLMLMAVVSLVPFGSAMVGTYPNAISSMVIFSSIMTLNGIVAAMLSWHIFRSRHLHHEREMSPLAARGSYQLLVFPFIAVVSVILAELHHPLVGISVWLVEPMVAFTFWWHKGRKVMGT